MSVGEMVFKKTFLKKVKSALGRDLIIIEPGTYVDKILLYKEKWAALEFKRDINSPTRPLQVSDIEMLDRLSFARFVYPQNEREVFLELIRFFKQ